MKRLLKWVGYIVGGVLAAILIFLGAIYVVTATRMGKTYPVQVETVARPADAAAIERGRHLALAVTWHWPWEMRGVSRRQPPSIGPIAQVLSVMTEFPLLPARMINRDATRPTPVTIGLTKEYGDYLVTTGGCKSCHNPNPSGGTAIEGVKVANLTPAGIGSWSEADFMKALHTGVRPDGRILSAVMPWPSTRHLTDDEIKAMWMYLQSLPARALGG